MSRTMVRSVSLSLNLFTIASGRLPMMSCRRCRAPIDLHQPNPVQPEQFLGTCTDCGCWYRVEVRPEEGRASVVLLPEVSEVRSAIPPEKGAG